MMPVPKRFLRAAAATVLLFAAAASVPVSALAAGSALDFGGNTLSAADRADVARIEQYLNSVKTLQARFIQTGHDGRQAGGQFSLSRPGKMRLTYDPPFKDFVVADGLFIFYWDAEMRQQSSAPVGSSLADVILRKEIKLSGDVTVKQLLRLPGALEATLVETADPGKGAITLIFQDKPLALIRWRILDAQGLTTEVGLLNAQFGVKLDPDLFTFREPADAKEPDGFSRK
jgi:outer membrane lipoprotein-sorting protein